MRHPYNNILLEIENQFRYQKYIEILEKMSKNYKEDSEEYSAIKLSIDLIDIECRKWEELLLEQMRDIILDEVKYQKKKKKESEEFGKSIDKLLSI